MEFYEASVRFFLSRFRLYLTRKTKGWQIEISMLKMNTNPYIEVGPLNCT